VSSAVFYRDLHATYQSVVSAEGMYLRTDGGQRILDAVGGAGTVVLGHGVRAITDAIAKHGTEVSFSYGATFTNPWQEQLAEALVAMNPRVARRVYFVSGGSEGNETAVKMARQYHLQCGRPGRHKVIARWQSFHGSTLATLSPAGASGSRPSRRHRPPWNRPDGCARSAMSSRASGWWRGSASTRDSRCAGSGIKGPGPLRAARRATPGWNTWRRRCRPEHAA
jgi:adenosylmethionine-8-amino-7-oxononanoate aminotransferase